MGPVINEGAMKSILNYIEIGKKEGRLVTGGERAPGDGYFIQPTVIADIDPMARLSQEEIFGPVLAVVKAKDFDDALAIANNTEYGLTGSVYTTTADKIERARREFHVGNLYINRKCTGAVVGAHPVRRLQYVRHGFEGRRRGLLVPVQPGQVDRTEAVKGAGPVRDVFRHLDTGAFAIRDCHDDQGVFPGEGVNKWRRRWSARRSAIRAPPPWRAPRFRRGNA